VRRKKTAETCCPRADPLTPIANREFRKRAVQQFTNWQPWASTLDFNGSRIVLISGSILTMRCVITFATKLLSAETRMEWALVSVKVASA
jgi:hypothetical protein